MFRRLKEKEGVHFFHDDGRTIDIIVREASRAVNGTWYEVRGASRISKFHAVPGELFISLEEGLRFGEHSGNHRPHQANAVFYLDDPKWRYEYRRYD